MMIRIIQNLLFGGQLELLTWGVEIIGFLYAAFFAGAAAGIGIKISANQGHKNLLYAACIRLEQHLVLKIENVEWRQQNIKEVLYVLGVQMFSLLNLVKATLLYHGRAHC
jgi:hypothetical protein